LAKFYYGGQAVMEGVMMRGQKHMAVAVRAPGGNIVVHQEPLDSAIYRHPVMKMPFLRGLVGLWDALGLGMKALMFSANIAIEEEDKAKADETPADEAAASTVPVPGVTTAPEGSASMGAAAWTSVAVALALMVALFFVLPVLGAGLITWLIGSDSSVMHNVIEGAIRLALFVGYIWAIGHMPDIKRVFGYHGAEHKTINAYEAGVELTPERVQSFTLLNPRCGTTFLLIVLVLATVLFVFLGKPPFLLMVLSRIVLVPLVAAVSYEFIRLMANLYHLPFIRAIMAPGIALQKMTTREPDLTMLEVGIAALTAVLVADGVIAVEQPARQEVEVFAEPTIA
jgi:uncharacterized protein YqhQ